MYRYITLIFLFLSYSFICAADIPAGNTLTGTVADAKGLPLQGAIVEIPDLKVGTVADSNGHYILENLPKGKFIIVASLISYSKTRKATP